jgi:hypothetical protein
MEEVGMAIDLGGIGNSAQGSKSGMAGRELKEFSVKRGDNGGVIVCETYRSTRPEGRRAGPSYPESSDYTENPFSPDDGDGAHAFVKGLLGKMGISGTEATTVSPAAPARAAVRGPFGGGAAAGPSGAAVRGPSGAVAGLGNPGY